MSYEEQEIMKTINIFAAATYVLKKQGLISTMKLQKLLYYCQAWSLVWDDAPLFNDRIEAWANGPVAPVLYNQHRGMYQVKVSDFSSLVQGELNDLQKETIDTVLEAYGGKSAQWLSDQTHSELPWQNAREGLSDSDRSNKEITLEVMGEYYGTL